MKHLIVITFMVAACGGGVEAPAPSGSAALDCNENRGNPGLPVSCPAELVEYRCAANTPPPGADCYIPPDLPDADYMANRAGAWCCLQQSPLVPAGSGGK